MKQNTTLCIAASALLLGLGGATADAQPGAYTPPAVAPGPAPAASQGWDGVQKFGVGLRLSNAGLSSRADRANKVDLGGGGLQVRYRLDRRWEFELSIEGLRAELQDGAVVRESSPATLAVLVHMRPEQRWDWYLIGGIGTTRDKVSYFSGETETGAEEFQSSHVHLGAGIERRFRKFGISAELRMVSSTRNNEELDAVQYGEGVDGPIPAESGGGQLSILGTYYF